VSAICASAADLKASVKALKDVNIRANGVSAVSDQFTKIQQELQTFKANAQGHYSTQVNALSDAMNHLRDSLDAAKASPSAGSLTTLAVYVKGVVTAGGNLVTAVSGTC
jgi:hypothetical protein